MGQKKNIKTKKKIMVVEDEENLRYMYERELTKEGYEVTLAGDGKEALNKINQKLPDLIILDIRMPNMDGLEALGSIVQRHKKIPVVINTAHAYYQDNFISWLADAYITKSPDLTELKDTIADLLQKAK